MAKKNQSYEYTPDSHKSLDKVAKKLLYSSLFGRKSGYFIIDSTEQHKVYFSALAHEDLFAVIPAVEHVWHAVDYKEFNPYLWLGVYIDIERINTPRYFVNRKELCDRINKFKGERAAIENDLLFDEINHCWYFIKDTKDNRGRPIQIKVPVVQGCFDAEIYHIKDIMQGVTDWCYKTAESITEIDLVNEVLPRHKPYLINIKDYKFRLLILDGVTSVSTEYHNKVTGDKIFKVKLGINKGVARPMFEYEDDQVKVLSIVQSSVYYTR